MYRVVPLPKRGNLTNEDVPASIMLYTANPIIAFSLLDPAGEGQHHYRSWLVLVVDGIIHTSMMLTVEMYGLQIG